MKQIESLCAMRGGYPMIVQDLRAYQRIRLIDLSAISSGRLCQVAPQWQDCGTCSRGSVGGVLRSAGKEPSLVMDSSILGGLPQHKVLRIKDPKWLPWRTYAYLSLRMLFLRNDPSSRRILTIHEAPSPDEVQGFRHNRTFKSPAKMFTSPETHFQSLSPSKSVPTLKHYFNPELFRMAAGWYWGLP